MNIFNRFFRKRKEIERLNTSEVFKTGGFPKYTFISRESLEERINDTLQNRDKALLFLGYSKCGKTVYRKQLFENDNFKRVTYRCNNQSTIPKLYEYISSELRLGQVITTTDANGIKYSESQGYTIGQKDTANISSTTTDEMNFSYAITEEHQRVKIDVNFLCNRIKDKEKTIIILEDYHLVNNDFNRTLSEDLKHFIDEEILFLLIGIPSSPNRALKNNPDLSGRTEHIIFDYLKREEIKELIKKGEGKLNVSFSEDVVEEIIKHSLKNAYLVQYLCKEILLLKGIKKTQNDLVHISETVDVKNACIKIAKELDKDYSDIYNTIKSGSRKQQENKAYNQYEEILTALKSINIETLENGIHYTDISRLSWSNIDTKMVKSLIKQGLYKDEISFKSGLTNQIRQAVERINSNLEKHTERPILYVHDMNIFLMDLIFKFYIDWREHVA